ncbi:hypothetical protein BH10PLA2_BH10PLA2_34760 [soil metagenome]
MPDSSLSLQTSGTARRPRALDLSNATAVNTSRMRRQPGVVKKSELRTAQNGEETSHHSEPFCSQLLKESQTEKAGRAVEATALWSTISVIRGPESGSGLPCH